MNPIYMGSSFLGGVCGRLMFPTNSQLFTTKCMVFSNNYYGFATIQMVFSTNSQVFTTIRPEVVTILLSKGTYMTHDETTAFLL